MAEPVYFASPDDLRAWFEQHHETAAELHVGYFKAASGRRGLTHQQAIEQALCFGWIDGIGRRVDDQRWRVRFTPRRTGSIWSDVNIASVGRLTEAGLMRPAGLAAFERRRADRTGVYSFEQRAQAALEPEQQARLEADPAVGMVLRPGAVVSPVRDALGDQREEARDTGVPPEPPDRRFRRRPLGPAPGPAHRRELTRVRI